VFQGVLSAIVALLFYTRAVAILGAARGAVFAALVPTFSLLLAIPLLGETPTQLQLVGVLLATAGMMFALGLHDPKRWRALPKRAALR
jgi:drug/metabolite transporter (DMT)-like permease